MEPVMTKIITLIMKEHFITLELCATSGGTMQSIGIRYQRS